MVPQALKRLIITIVSNTAEDPELYFEGVAMRFIGDQPTYAYALDIYIDISVCIRFITLNFRLKYNKYILQSPIHFSYYFNCSRHTYLQ